MIRVLLADDHAIVRSGLKQIFTLVDDIEVCAEAANGAQVLEQVGTNSELDLLLLDLNMPGISGADLITRVKCHRADLPILVLSMHNEAQIAGRMLKAGATGYITKDCNPQILLTAIRKVSGGGKYIDPEIAQNMFFGESHADRRHQLDRLSAREFEIFGLLAEGMSVNEISAKLVISNKTVSTHKARLMEKLQLANMADLMRFAIERQSED